jgi:hypothetical protein
VYVNGGVRAGASYEISSYGGFRLLGAAVDDDEAFISISKFKVKPSSALSTKQRLPYAFLHGWGRQSAKQPKAPSRRQQARREEQEAKRKRATRTRETRTRRRTRRSRV